jgi:uncharacterized protein
MRAAGRRPGARPAAVVEGATGRGLRATRDVAAGTVVGRFEGPRVPYDAIPPEDVRHALWQPDRLWLIPRTDARYANHGCRPTCRIESERPELVTIEDVVRGGELTIAYNLVTRAEHGADPAAFFWDERWTFDCRCGAVECMGRIDGYRFAEDRRPLGFADEAGPRARAGRLRVGPANGLGRGVFAETDFARGELLERAPALVIPDTQWTRIEPTVLFDYTFAFGPALEHAAIALGLGTLMNHSYTPNAVYVRRFAERVIEFFALREIRAGDEVRVNYTGSPGGRRPLWFPVTE